MMPSDMPKHKDLTPENLRENPATAAFAHLWTRRDFFSLAGWAAFFASLVLSTLASLRFMFPRVLFEPLTYFKAGYPDEYPVGVVNTNFISTQRVWIIREKEGFYALFARCTHLGCTPYWLEIEEKFKCPCHGSGFTKEGVNFEGPAPRALERVKVSLADDGQILIDKSKLFIYEKGEWNDPEAFLRI